MTNQMEGSEQQLSEEENGSMGQSRSLVGQPGLHGMKTLNPELLTNDVGLSLWAYEENYFT